MGQTQQGVVMPSLVATPVRLASLAGHLAMRNLLQDPLRLAISVLGIALAVMLILFLFGLRTGVLKGAGVYLANTPGTLVVLPDGIENTAAASSQFLAPDVVTSVANVPGVELATPILRMDAAVELHDKTELLRLVGYDVSLGGGPWDLAAGRNLRADDEVVLDRVLATRHRLEVGDTFTLAGQQLTVVGLSDGTISWTGAYVFTSKAFVEGLLLAPGSTSFVLVTPAGGVVAGALADDLAAISGASVLSKEDVIANNEQILAGIVDQVVLLMVGAAFVVGALVVGMVIYTATTERQREYGVLKAIGARNATLYRIVIAQALGAAALGAINGITLAFVMSWLVNRWQPQYLVSIEPMALAAALAAGLVMAIIGGLVPARAIAGLPPADVFRR
jgi:putative ABC transport system permease protein